MFKQLTSAVTALALVTLGVGALGGVAAAQTPAGVVTSADIAPTETPENYTSWHQGMDPGGSYASTTSGLLIAGKTQIIKGETALPAVTDVLAYAQSSRIVSAGDPVWHQISFGLSDGTWTTLRALSGQESGNWVTSQALNGIPKGGAAPLPALLSGLNGELSYLAGGFFVDTNKRSTVQSYTVNGVTTSFALDSLAGPAATTVRVGADQIRPDETEYFGWHDGAAAGGSYTTMDAGLAVTGKVQVLNGEENSSTQVAQFVTGLSIEATGETWLQVPVFYGATPSFTTLRATPDMAAAGTWATSRAIPGFAAGAQAQIEDFALALGQHQVVGYGFFVDAGKTATVASFTANGTQTLFTPFVPRTDLPGVGVGQGADVAPPTAESTLPVKPGGSLELSAPEGIFEPGELVTVSLQLTPATEVPAAEIPAADELAAETAGAVARGAAAFGAADAVGDPVPLGEFTADAETGAVAAEAALPADLAAGAYRVLYQGANSYYWAPAALTVADTSDPGTGEPGTEDPETGGPETGGPETGGPQVPTPGSSNPNGAATPAAKVLAQTGGEPQLIPLALAGGALLLGAGLMLRRRREA